MAYAHPRTGLITRLLDVVWLHDDRTFRVVVNESFSATYDAEGNPIGYSLRGKHLDDGVMMGILAEDKEQVIEAAFKKVTKS